MKVIISILIILTLHSCTSSKIIPISGTYAETPYVITTNSSFDSVWDKLIDLFAQKGLPIKIIDRSSGLVISDQSILPATFELKTGGLKDPSAFIVLPKYYNSGAKKTYTIAGLSNVTGEWNVRIKTAGQGTTINVNIVNLKYFEPSIYTKLSKEVLVSSFKSTGVFENIISELIK